MKISVLFVCLGNICRSPMAEAIFRHYVETNGMAQHFHIDSAGTGDWHAGEPPHNGTISILAEYGINSSGMVARQVTRSDLEEFDYVIAMDRSNLNDLQDICNSLEIDPGCTLALMTDYLNAKRTSRDVPDPWYHHNFDDVFELLSDACNGLLKSISKG